MKRLSKSSGQEIQEFKNEVDIVGQFQHRNLITLSGFSVKEDE
jgi:hypothetical protein